MSISLCSCYSFAHSTHVSSCGAVTRTTLTSAKPRRAPPLTGPSVLLEKSDCKPCFGQICPMEFSFVHVWFHFSFLFCLSLSSVVLQRSLHVEEPQPGEAGRRLGLLEQVGLLLSLLRNRRSLTDAPVQQPSVSSAAWRQLPRLTHISSSTSA